MSHLLDRRTAGMLGEDSTRIHEQDWGEFIVLFSETEILRGKRECCRQIIM